MLMMAVFVAMLTGCTGDWADLSESQNGGGEGALAAHQIPDDSPGQTAIYPMITVLPTYPAQLYESQQKDEVYNWPYLRFDQEAYLLDDPQPTTRAYRMIVFENEFLRLFLLPELGGRIWQVIHKPSGNVVFYQNPVVKPSPWGPATQKGWTGLGGLEWNLPVIEHGYDWGTPWDVRTFHDEDGTAVAQISTPEDGRFLSAIIEVRLPPDAAYFELEPHLLNNSDGPLDFDYWHNAMLAPGHSNHPSPELRFVLPGEAVRIHSTGDPRLPAPNSVISWPEYRARDLSKLGEWDQYLGLFEYPAAHGPFAGVYEPAADTGIVRVFPASVARGSKIFGLGWGDALTSEYYTDDDSAYVELHGGIAPTFSDHAHLDAGESVTWKEQWYPVQGIGQFSTASTAGALSWYIADDTLTVHFYPVEALTGKLVLRSLNGKVIARQDVEARASVPIPLTFDLGMMNEDDGLPSGMTISLLDANGSEVLSGIIDLS
ncbi:MAG: DUF5107 domain-containing protein [Caldilineaceae bacterium]